LRFAFIDGQILFHHSREAFGCRFPNYDIPKLAENIAKAQAWNLIGIHFYTGVPDAGDDPRWNRFWTNRLAAMGGPGISVFSRPLRYRNQTVRLSDESTHMFPHGEEKGVDVRFAPDIIGKAVRNEYDVVLVFSQDQDLSEVADEIRDLGRQQDRRIKLACAYPISPTVRNRRGINGTDWIRIPRATCDACCDPKDNRQALG